MKTNQQTDPLADHRQGIKTLQTKADHAAQLAEAIAKIRTAMDRGLDLTPSIYGAIATLKAYEAAQ
jgi:2-phospho-L-lactate transferase/gluconeogenesis factor (CofD/UPF0052 family)